MVVAGPVRVNGGWGSAAAVVSVRRRAAGGGGSGLAGGAAREGTLLTGRVLVGDCRPIVVRPPSRRPRSASGYDQRRQLLQQGMCVVLR